MNDFRERIEKLSPKRLMLLALELQSRLEAVEKESKEPIAIVGLGCRIPGGIGGPQEFWSLLDAGRSSVSEAPLDRWDVSAYYDPDPDAPGRMSTKFGSFLSHVDLFDAPFFSIARREAVSMDPQQRLLLEVCWEALENAGHSPRKLVGTPTGVYLGMCTNEYQDLLLARGEAAIDGYLASGTAPSIAAGRISYILGLQGPSLAVDTACSASLVALHLACQSLRTHETRMALAGGVNVMLLPEATIALSKAHMMAPDGRCKAFDARADGFVRGEGCGIVVLKRLSDAVADRDHIWAVIRGTAVNQDGRSSGLTAPNGVAQEALLKQALANAGVKGEEIGYIEAHGTGTALGDPIEAHALAAVLGPGRTKENPLVVGSVKTNVGHLEAAAGVAGLIKVVLSMAKEEIPRHLHFEKMNLHIDWGGVPVEIPVRGREWKRGEKRRLAGVSSFGFSGTNAHVILEEAPEEAAPKREVERPVHLLALSGRTMEALQELAGRYAEELRETTAELGDICYTANAGRAHFEHRLAVVGKTVEEVREKLEKSRSGTEVKERNGVRPVFLFSGQGAQFVGMGKELYETQPVFRAAIDRCEEILRGEGLREPLKEVLWGRASGELEQTEYTQPALFAVEWGLAELWKSWGIEPGVVLGHSVGEYVAACVAGVYGLEEGLRLIAARGRLMQGVSGRGAMAAVEAEPGVVREALKGLEEQVTIAAENGPTSVVISGYEEGLKIAEERLKAKQIRVKRLAVSHGFHSPQMKEMEAEFEQLAGRVSYGVPRVKLVSSVTGEEIGRGEITASYWRRQVREAVRFAAAMETLQKLGPKVFVEIGPGTTLLGLGRQCLGTTEGAEKQLWLPSLRKGRGDWEQLLESLGKLYERGAEVDWEGFDRPYGRRRVPLPTYPFQRQRYWIEPAPKALTNASAHQSKSVQSDGVPDDWYYQLTWELKPYARAHEANVDPAQSLQLAKQLDRHAAELITEHGLDQFAALSGELRAIVTAYIAQALRATGYDFPLDSRVTTEEIAIRCNIPAKRRLLLGRFLEILAEDGVLGKENGAWLVLRKPVTDSSDAGMNALRSSYPAFDPELEMTARCAPSLASVLRGETDPLTLLFPGGSSKNAERIYTDSPGPRVFNRLVADVVSAEVQRRPEGTVRVLEIGAGTGGTTAYVAPVLPQQRTEYVYTDISVGFKAKAAEKFKQYPFFQYRTLDIEKDLAEQGFEPGQFDIILATNVLHATADLRETLKRVRALLRPGGVVVLSEVTSLERWVDLTFGLTDGWWRFRDRDLRPSGPVISAQTWRNLLAEMGFSHPEAVQFPGIPQAVIYARASEEPSKPSRYLIVPDHQGVAAELAAKLRADGETVAVANTTENVAEHLRSSSYDLVLHLAALDSPVSGEFDSATLAASESTLMSSVFATMQLAASTQTKLCLATAGAQPVLRDQSFLNIAQTPVWGLSKTFALEHPNQWGGLVDLDPHSDSGERAADLLTFLRHRDKEDQSAIRNGSRYVARLSHCQPLVPNEPRFHSQKVYVLAGGLGELGLNVARWMADRGARNIILVSRRPPTAEAEELIRSIRSQGIHVEVRRADIASRSAVESLFADVQRNIGPIGGVVHAAGHLDDGVLEGQSWERMEEVISPKVVGAWNLHEVTRSLNLDFFVLFSSISSLTGSAGTSSYAAGNAFMDALAHYRQSIGLPALSINWGVWEGAGMATRLARGAGRKAGLPLMPRSLALAALGAALSTDNPQVAIGAIDWSVQKPIYAGKAQRPLLEHVSIAGNGTGASLSVRQKTQALPLVSPRSGASERGDGRESHREQTQLPLIDHLTETVAKILAFDPSGIDAADPLIDYGMDSLMALEFKNRISADFGVSISTARLVEGISLQEVAVLIGGEQKGAVAPQFEAQPPKLEASSEEEPLEAILATPPSHRRSRITSYLVNVIAPILTVDPASIDFARPLIDYGLDSLMAHEFKNRISEDLAITIPTAELLEGRSLQEIASDIVAKLQDSGRTECASSTLEPVVEYPLSYIQQQMWFVHKLSPEAATFNVAVTAKAEPHLNWPVFQRAVAKLLKRHAALRAIFVDTDNGPMQRILPPDTPMSFLIDATAIDESDLRALIQSDFERNFDLGGPLVRVNVYRRTDYDVIYLNFDHLVTDHWSVQLCFEDLKKLYTAELNGTEPALRPLRSEYKDFVKWEASIGEDPNLEKQWEYWKEQLGGELPTLEIPGSRPRPEALTARGEAIPLTLPDGLEAGIQRIARPLKTTGYTFLLAAFQILLHRYSRQNDIVVGTSSSGREDARWANTVGFFVNLLPIRARLTGNATFAEHLVRMRDTVLGAIKHQEFPFSLMMNRLRVRRGLERRPVYQAFFNFLTDRSGEFGALFMGVQGRPVQFGSSVLTPFMTLVQSGGLNDLVVQLVEVDGELAGFLNYNSDVIQRSTADAMAAAYSSILEAVIRNPEIPIEDLESDSESAGREEIVL